MYQFSLKNRSQMGAKKSKLKGDELETLRTDTEFSDDELKEWHHWYRSILFDCPNGRMDIEEFKKIYNRMFPSGVDDKYAEHVFRTFDANKDGHIDFREFVCSLSITSRGSLEEKLQWAFKVYDIDEDGFITRKEMLEIVKAIFKMSRQNSLSHHLTVSEDASTPEQRVDDIIKELDTNMDGKLSEKEFVEGSKNNPAIVGKLLQINRRKSSIKDIKGTIRVGQDVSD